MEAVAKWCTELVESGKEPPPKAIFADHVPEHVANFRQHSGLHVRMADKATIDEGIQLVQGLFDLRGDGQPSIYFRPDMRSHPADPDLEASGRPTGLLEELTAYTWDTSNPDRPKDEPIDHSNHSCDALRYLTRGILRGRGAELATGSNDRQQIADHTYL